MSKEQGEASNEVREQLAFMGRRTEVAIISGQPEIINEPERQWVRGMLEREGVKLADVKEKGDMDKQAGRVLEALGEEKMINCVVNTVARLVYLEGGSVWGKGVKRPSLGRESVEKFLGDYMREQIAGGEFDFSPKKYEGDGTPGSDWKTNTIYRAEAVISAINRVLYIAGADDAEESLRRQTCESTLQRLRERVLRGAERGSRKVGADVVRFGSEKDRKAIRYLPEDGVGVVLEELVDDRSVKTDKEVDFVKVGERELVMALSRLDGGLHKIEINWGDDETLGNISGLAWSEELKAWEVLPETSEDGRTAEDRWDRTVYLVKDGDGVYYFADGYSYDDEEGEGFNAMVNLDIAEEAYAILLDKQKR